MKDLYHKLLKALAHFQVEHPVFSLLLIAALTTMIFGGVGQVRTVASLEQMMPKEVEEIKAFDTLRDNHMGQDMIAVVVQLDRHSSLEEEAVMDMRDYEVYSYVRTLKDAMADEPDVLEVYAFSDIIDLQTGDDAPVDQHTYTALMQESWAAGLMDEYINDDARITIVLATTDVSADDPRMNLLSSQIREHVSSIGKPPGTEILFTGTPIIQQRLGDLISADRKNTQWISTLLVFIITMIIFGTFTSALVPIVIVTLSVNWLYGTMGYAGLPISTLAGGVAAMVVGIGIDFAIHIMNKFKYERKKGLSVKQAIEQAVVDTGTALTATSVTTIAAFLAFLVGVMPEMGRFGILMAIGISYSLLFSLVGLPALLVIEERLIYALQKKMAFGVEGELHLVSDRPGCEPSQHPFSLRTIAKKLMGKRRPPTSGVQGGKE
ncbi:MAG: efflux RND transporter permease subunit [Nanoarchaeota archaeon]